MGEVESVTIYMSKKNKQAYQQCYAGVCNKRCPLYKTGGLKCQLIQNLARAAENPALKEE